jgi:hypothetical protein
MAVRSLTIGPSYLGLVKSTPYQRHPSQAVTASSDAWPIDPRTGRARLSTRPGYANFGSSLTNVNLIYSLNVAASETTESPPTYKRQLMIAREGELYKNTGTGTTFTQVGASNIIDTGRNVQAAHYGQRMFIANVTNSYVVYDFHNDGVAAWTGSSGPGGPAAPQDCPVIASWGGRIVLAGRDKTPHIVHFSRADDPDDWNFAADDIRDIGKAVAVPNVDAPITALIPHNNDCLLAGTLTSTWIFSGNPTVGTLRQLSPVVGPINATAWCRDPYGVIYCLTRLGLYKMEGPCGAPLVPVSERKIPESLLALDGVNDLAYLEYDSRFKCIHIYIESSTNAQYFHYFPETDSFWQSTTPGATIRAIGRYDLLDTADASGVLIGTALQLKRLDSETATGVAASAHILVKLAPLGTEAIITSGTTKWGDNTNDTTGVFALCGAASAEAAVAAPTTRKFSTTIGTIQNNNNNYTPRVSGQSALMTITQTDTTKFWSYEETTLQIAPRGKGRGA